VPLGVTGHAHQGGQAPGIAESQSGQVHRHRPGMPVDDIPDVVNGQFGTEDIQVAAKVHDGLSSGAEAVAQLHRCGARWIVPGRHGYFVNGIVPRQRIYASWLHSPATPSARGVQGCATSVHSAGTRVITRNRVI